MPSPKAARTTRRLLKLASLGLAGLLAGLLSGCSSSPSPSSVATYTQPHSLDGLRHTDAPASHYTHPIPDLKHAPIPHRIETWADRTPHPAPSPFSTQLDGGQTLTNYAFSSGPSQSNPGTGHLTLQ